jgi:hypothetical protein
MCHFKGYMNLTIFQSPRTILSALPAARLGRSLFRISARRLQTIALLTIAVSAASAEAGIITGPVINPANGHGYYLLTEKNWSNSEAEAVGLGGHLVTINDATENSWVTSTFANFTGVPRALWIGFNDVAAEGTFVWASGEPVSYTNWGPAVEGLPPEPNDIGGRENWAHIFPPTDSAGRYPTWNDAPDQANAFGFVFNGVVERAAVPEPTSMLLLLVVAGSPLAINRRTHRAH